MGNPRSPEARVKAGAELLDAKVPDWFTKISLAKLQMSNPCQCIVGQLYSSYIEGLKSLALWGSDSSVSTDYGFDCLVGAVSLTVHWRREIEARLAAAAPVFSSEPQTDEAIGG